MAGEVAETPAAVGPLWVGAYRKTSVALGTGGGIGAPVLAVHVEIPASVAVGQRVRPDAGLAPVLAPCLGDVDGSRQCPIRQIGEGGRNRGAGDQLVRPARGHEARGRRGGAVREPGFIGTWQAGSGGQSLADGIGAAEAAEVPAVQRAAEEDATGTTRPTRGWWRRRITGWRLSRGARGLRRA